MSIYRAIARGFRVVTGLVLVCGPVAWARAETPKRVLILDSFGRDVAPFNAAVAEFRTTLARELGAPVDIYEASLDAARFAEPEKEGPFVEFLRSRFEGRPVDLIVPTGAPAVRLTNKYRASLFPNAQVVYMGVDPRLMPPDALTSGATLVTQRVNLPGIIEDILQIQPDTTYIAVIFGASPLEKYWVSECRREFKAFEGRVGFMWLNEFALDQIEKRVAALPPKSFVLYVMMVVDASGVPYDNDEALSRIYTAANAPVYGYFSGDFGRGGIGGRLYQETELGARAARAAVRVLRGERAEGISPEILGDAAPVYDWRELKRWGIAEAGLPAGSVIRFREPSLWQRYTGQIVTVAVVFLLAAGLIVLLLVNLAMRRRAERSLLENRNRLRAILDTAVESIITVDERGLIESVNAATEKMFGFSAGELIGQNVRMLMPSPHREDHDRYVADYLRTRQPKIIGIGREMTGRRKDGTLFPLDLVVSETVFDGRWVFTGFVRDLTEQKRSAAESKELRDHLAHLTRVKTLDALSGSLAHELNQPLGIILSNSEAAQELLQKDPPDITEVQAILSDIVAADRRAARVIDGLRAMHKRVQAVLQPVELGPLIEEVLQLTRADLVSRGVTMGFETAPGLPMVRGDRVQLQQLILNLILNAADAVCDNEPGRRRVEVVAKRNGHAVFISVRDEGKGLPEDVEKIFQSFFTTKPNGLGMGLTICRSIAAAHHGRIWAERHPAGGAVFHVELPDADVQEGR